LITEEPPEWEARLYFTSVDSSPSGAVTCSAPLRFKLRPRPSSLAGEKKSHHDQAELKLSIGHRVSDLIWRNNLPPMTPLLDFLQHDRILQSLCQTYNALIVKGHRGRLFFGLTLRYRQLHSHPTWLIYAHMNSLGSQPQKRHQTIQIRMLQHQNLDSFCKAARIGDRPYKFSIVGDAEMG